jgi:hypothetical protein
MITNERKLELRKAAAALARVAVERAAVVTVRPAAAATPEEDRYARKYLACLAKKITYSVFIDEADL